MSHSRRISALGALFACFKLAGSDAGLNTFNNPEKSRIEQTMSERREALCNEVLRGVESSAKRRLVFGGVCSNNLQS